MGRGTCVLRSARPLEFSSQRMPFSGFQQRACADLIWGLIAVFMPLSSQRRWDTRVVIRSLSIAITLANTAALACGQSDRARVQEHAPLTNERQVANMKISIIIGGKSVTATLAGNDTAKDFVSLLPLTLTLKDYADNEKISDLTKRLSAKNAPATYDPSAGDITYYAPWGNLALFHKDGHDSPGLIKLGSIDSGIELLRQPGALKATFECMKK